MVSWSDTSRLINIGAPKRIYHHSHTNLKFKVYEIDVIISKDSVTSMSTCIFHSYETTSVLEEKKRLVCIKMINNNKSIRINRIIPFYFN